MEKSNTYDMKHSTNYLRFAEKFITYTIEQLIELFNREVGNNAWTSMRAAHDCALIDEFRRRNIDVSAISNGDMISFNYPVMYDETGKRLLAVVPLRKSGK